MSIASSLLSFIPGIGPFLGAGVDALSGLGQSAGNQAGAAAQGRLAEGQLNQHQDQNALDFYKTGLGTALNVPQALANSTAAGDNLANVKDVTISGLPPGVSIPQISGGLRPSNLGPNARQAGQQLSRQSLLNLMSNPQQFNLPQMPTQTPLPQPSGYDDAMKWIGRGAGLAGAVIPHIPGLGQPQQPQSPDEWTY